MKIIYLGTPEFAIEPLKILLENNYNIVGVVTAIDQPAGRGLHLKQSAVKEFALQHNLKIFQPEKLNDPVFLDQLKQLDADLQVVVAFRMMPRSLWSMPRLGTINLHASLLPQYRGAAPINRAIMNGETETGVTTFFLQHEIDTGNILFSDKIEIGENETAGELHDKLKKLGARLILKTVKAIEIGNYKEIPQTESLHTKSELKVAPKIFKEDCEIDFSKNVKVIHNQIRGLSPYPAAFFKIYTNDGKELLIKVFKAEKVEDSLKIFSNEIQCDNKTNIKIQCNAGYLLIKELQMAGKKRMKVEEFLKGFKINGLKIV